MVRKLNSATTWLTNRVQKIRDELEQLLDDDDDDELEPSQSDLTESQEAPSTLPATVGHGLEELNWQDIDLKTESTPSSESISPINVPESLNATDIEVDSSKVDDASPVEVEQTTVIEIIERVNEAEKELSTADVSDASDEGTQSANNLELGDAYKLAVSSRGRQLSSKTLEQLLGKDSTRVSKDLKLLLAQISVARGLEIPLASMISPRVSANLEDSRALDALASIGIQMLHKRISL